MGLQECGPIDDEKTTSQGATVQALFAKFLKDPTIAEAPKAVEIRHPVEFFSEEYTIGELLDNPKTRPLVEKYLPNLPTVGFIRALTVENLKSFAGTVQIGDVFGLAGELARTPVSP